MNDEDFMALALAQAKISGDAGEVPVGAVVVRQGEVIAVGRNTPIAEHDPTAHAEIVALRAAAQVLGNYRLDECELFVTLEPCAMCSGAMLNARLKRVVFGALEPKTGAAGSVINLFEQPQFNHQTELRGGVLAEKGRALLQVFFRQRRFAQREASRLRLPLRDDALRTPDAAFQGLSEYQWPPHYLGDLPSLDGLRMHYLDEQDACLRACDTPARTYLCLHGSPTWSYSFRNLIPSLLQSGHRVVAPDLIGFGKSDKPKKDGFHTFIRHRQILLELVETLDLQNIVLVLAGQGIPLGLTLPVAAAGRYQGLRIMDSTMQSPEDDLPLKDGFRIWSQIHSGLLVGYEKKSKDANDLPINLETGSAYDAPFPDRGYRAAIRAFQVMALNCENSDCSAITHEVERFWRQC
jgi:tRNA(adenine34) deaminase